MNDTGPGIAEDRREAIFEEFQRDGAPAGTSGFGLGLSIVRRLARRWTTRVDLASRPGFGSTFAISAPIDDAASLAGPAGRRSRADGSEAWNGADVLLIENEHAVAQAMQALLERWGCGVLVAASGAKRGSATRAAEQPDLIIADLHLDNGELGFEAIRQSRTKSTAVPRSSSRRIIPKGSTRPRRRSGWKCCASR